MNPRPLVVLALLAMLSACSDSAPQQGGDALAARGEKIYGNVCTACHNADPNRDGSAGPAIAGSSRELVAARVVRGEYPPGYMPKRPTQVMPAFPYLEPEVDALTAYLQAAAK